MTLSISNILITDSHYDIIYINKAAQQLFAKYESIIQKHLPHFGGVIKIAMHKNGKYWKILKVRTILELISVR